MSDMNCDAGVPSLLEAQIAKQRVLWGREAERKRLHDLALAICNKKNNGSCTVALIHGPSGSGKTALCESLRKGVSSKGFCHLFGKFDQYEDNASPYSALVQALNSLLPPTDQSTSRSAENTPLLSCLKKTLKGEAKALCDLVPSFASLADHKATKNDRNADEEDASSIRDMMRASERLAVAVLALLQAVCTAERPIIFVIDDLQWADSNSMEVFRAVIGSTALSHLLFLFVYRDDGERAGPTIQDKLMGDAHGQERVHDIALSNLNQSDVSNMVRDLLSINDTADKKCADLVDLTFLKTLGNPYFVVQFLVMLQRRTLLKFNYATLQWQWDLEQIKQATSVADNVLIVLTHRIQSLPPSMLPMLQLAACLGYFFDAQLLERLFHKLASSELTFLHATDADGEEEARSRFGSAIEQAVSENLVEQSVKPAYRFTHDKIQQSIYELLPSEKARRLHWWIGLQIRQETADQGAAPQTNLLFLAVDQLNMGSSCIVTEDERLDLIRLNYDASLSARHERRFALAGRFLGHAISLVREKDWDKHYDFLVSLFNAMVVWQTSSDSHEAALATADLVVRRARKPEDRIIALASRSRIRHAQLDFVAAVKDAKQALILCGEPMRRSNTISVLWELWKVRRMLRGKSDNEMLALPEMTQSNKKHAMGLLLDINLYCWEQEPATFVLSALQALRTSVQHGRCGFTGTSFALSGALMDLVGDSKMASRLVDLAFRAEGSEKVPAELTVAAYSCVLPTKLPIASFLEPCLAGYRYGLETGDSFYGSLCLVLYTLSYLISGYRLDALALDLRKFMEQLRVLRLRLSQIWQLPSLQVAMNLSGQSKKPSIISWELMVEDGLLAQVDNPEDRNHAAELGLLYHQLFNAYILRDAGRVTASLNKILAFSEKERQFAGGHLANFGFALYGGLAGFWLGSEDSKFKKFASSWLKWLERRPNINSVPIIMLLRAQKESIRQPANLGNLRRMYDDVIVMAARSGLVHLGAIANEQVGEFLLKREDWSITAKTYLRRSVALYKEWGATVKSTQMAETHGLQDVNKTHIVGSALRGRERFNASLDAAHSSSGIQVQVPPK